ncbi:MAG: hypothetical protein L0229_26470, partial [Blastocatellia bacterium]|nr:hypothetical protein [Blastocatellia bacterium]
SGVLTDHVSNQGGTPGAGKAPLPSVRRRPVVRAGEQSSGYETTLTDIKSKINAQIAAGQLPDRALMREFRRLQAEAQCVICGQSSGP